MNKKIKKMKKRIKKRIFLFSSIAFLTPFVDFIPAKAFDLGTFWYGVGVGITETLCISTESGYIKNYSARTLLRTYRKNFAKNANFDSRSFEDGVQIAFDTYPSCRL